MKSLAALCLLMSAVACDVHGLDIYTEHWEVPANPAADEDPVRFTPAFTSVKPSPICEDTHSLLEGPHGERFILSQPLHTGEFSTFHYALDHNGLLWGVKKVPLGAPGAERPTISETGLGRQLALWDAVHPRSLAHRAVLRHGNDAYALMPAMDGSVDALEALAQRSTLARQMVLQVAGDAAQLHALGYVHHDVRPQNILWSREGTLALADFNLARKLDKNGQLTRTSWYVVAQTDEGVAVRELIAAPEMRVGAHDAKADTWSLGLAALEVLVNQPALFDALQKELAHGTYWRWHATVVGQDGTAHLSRIEDPAHVRVAAERRLYSEVFTRARAQDPELTEAILGGMLVPNPMQRWSMQQVQERAPKTPREALGLALKHTVARHDDLRRARREALTRCAAQATPPEGGPAQDPRTTRKPEEASPQALGFRGLGQDPCALADPAMVAMPTEPASVEDSGSSVRY